MTPAESDPLDVVGGVASVGAAAVLGGVVTGVRGPVVELLRSTVLRPLLLGPQVAAAWAVTRDAAAGLLAVALLYGVLRSQLGPLVGLQEYAPWRLLMRLALAAVGIPSSLPLARGLLAANNAFCAAVLARAPGGPDGVVHPLVAASAVALVPSAASVGADATALLVLIGIAALGCFYLIRAAEIILLTLLLPLAAALWVVPAAEGVYRSVAGHLLVSVFVQAVQVLVLLIFATGLGAIGPQAGTDWPWAIAALALVFRCRGLLAAAVAATANWVPGPGQLALAVMPAISGARRVIGRV